MVCHSCVVSPHHPALPVIATLRKRGESNPSRECIRRGVFLCPKAAAAYNVNRCIAPENSKTSCF
jgi:hypothetical protein